MREFVVNFSKKWKYRPGKKAFLHSIPSYRYIIHKGKRIYEDFCKWMLLTDKPGCTLENVGKAHFESCEEELKNFVENSEFCPELVKKDFYDSQVAVEGDPNEKPYERDAAEDLYKNPETIPENAPLEDWMKAHGLGATDDADGQEAPEPPLFDVEIVENDEHDMADPNDKWDNYDWQSDRERLNITYEDIKKCWKMD